MDIHINLPEKLTKEARQVSNQMGLTFDELLTAALTAFLNTQQANIIATLNEIYKTEESKLNSDLITIQTKSLENEKW